MRRAEAEASRGAQLYEKHGRKNRLGAVIQVQAIAGGAILPRIAPRPNANNLKQGVAKIDEAQASIAKLLEKLGELKEKGASSSELQEAIKALESAKGQLDEARAKLKVGK